MEETVTSVLTLNIQMWMAQSALQIITATILLNTSTLTEPARYVLSSIIQILALITGAAPKNLAQMEPISLIPLVEGKIVDLGLDLMIHDAFMLEGAFKIHATGTPKSG